MKFQIPVINKFIKKIISIILFSVICLTACGGPVIHKLIEGKLVLVEVTSVTTAIAAGTSTQFTATAIYSSRRKEDVTNSVQWSSSNMFAASISDLGVVEGIIPGLTTITADYNGISGSNQLTVSDAVLVSLNVTPVNAVRVAGTTQQFTATGMFSDDSTQDLSSSVIWTSSNNLIATVSNDAGSKGLGLAVDTGTTSITATSGSISGGTDFIVTAAELVSINVTPLSTSRASGTSQQFTATGIYTNGSNQNLTTMVTWTSSDNLIATVSNAAGVQGYGIAEDIGSVTITATLGAISGNTGFTVTPATLDSIAVTPVNSSCAKGTIQQFTATGIYTDSTTQDITALATWSSDDGLTASISNGSGTEGRCDAVDTGSVNVTASMDGINGSAIFTVTPAALVSISVTPTDPVKAKGLTQQFVATGTYTDSSTQDITSSVTWTSSNDAIATVSNASGSRGAGYAANIGNVSISAASGAINGSTGFTITPATLVSIGVTPINQSKAAGSSQQFSAIGTYTDSTTQDLTTSVTWSSDNGLIASISNTDGSRGLCSAVSAGSVVIKGLSGAVEGTTGFTVTAATLVSIDVTPASQNKAAGTTQQFTATGTYSDSTTQDLTLAVNWSSDDNLKATVSNVDGSRGLCTALSAGGVIITATSGAVSGSTGLTVTAVALLSIDITPVNPGKTKGTTQQFTATGTYDDSSTQDITTSVTWSSSDDSVATVSNAAGSKGLGTAVNTGAAIITAVSGAISNTTDFTVTAATLTSISVTPVNSSLTVNRNQQYTATGTYSDSTTQDITSSVTWGSSNTAYADISNTAGSKGMATTISAGSTIISATSGSINGTTNLNVTSAALVSIMINPVNPDLAAGMTLQFQATGIYSDSSTQDVTTDASWSSSLPGKAAISNAAGSKGLATGVSSGNTVITATIGLVSGSTTLGVTFATMVAVTVSPMNLNIIANGTTRQFIATGVFSDSTTLDITEQVSWSSGTTGVATISNASGSKGFSTSAGSGITVITAAHIASGLSGNTNLTVSNATIESISILPVSPVLFNYGTTLPFRATGNYSDMTTQDITSSVTWSSSAAGVATISNAFGSNGLAVSVAAGTATITAQLGAVSGNTTLEVRIAALQSLVIAPLNPAVALPGTIQFTVEGTFSDSTVQDLTSQVLWSSDNPGAAVISNALDTKGFANTIASGSSVISASKSGITGTTTLTVNDDSIAPVISGVSLIDASRVQVSFSEPVDIAEASNAANYKITRSPAGICSDSSNFSGSSQTADFIVNSVTAVSLTDYILNLSGSMQSVPYTLLGDRSAICDLAAIPNYLECPNNIDFTGTDTVPPTVRSASSMNTTTVRIIFSENVNSSEAQNTGNYKIVNSPVSGICSDNSNFTASTQTPDFTIQSVTGSGREYTITLSATQVSGKSYTVVVNRNGIHDLAAIPNQLGCANYADFTGREQLKVLSAQSVTLKSFIVTFSKAVKAGVNIAGSAGATTALESAKRYKLSTELGAVTSAAILDGVVCNGAAADSTKVCVTHATDQGGSQYTVLVANNVNSDGFDNTTWGSIRNSTDTENIQTSPKDRTTFLGSGNPVQDIVDGPLIADPFGDGTLSGFLFKFGDMIYIGPNQTGNSAIRINADGSNPANISFSIIKDIIGSNSHRNTLTGPFTSFGYTGCTGNACGPDLENGRGLYTGGTVLGTDYLFYGGVRTSSELDYIYYTSDIDSELDFNYVDLDDSIGMYAMSFTSLRVFGDRVYLGFPGDGGSRPYFLSLIRLVQNPVGNGFSNPCNPVIHDLCTLNLYSMPYLGNNGSPGNPANYQGIDSMMEYNGKLYIANNGGVVRTANSTPLDYLTYPSHWDLTPSASLAVLEPLHYNKSIRLSRVNDILKNEMAYPQMAVYRGNLYVIRNACKIDAFDATYPSLSCSTANMKAQLWKFDGTNWTRMVQTNYSGNYITNMGYTNNKYITMVVRNGGTDSTGGTLYVGFDNTVDGAQIWKTTADNPSAIGDWTGPVGGSGLGSGVKYIYDGISAAYLGINYIYITAGSAAGGVKVFRSTQ